MRPIKGRINLDAREVISVMGQMGQTASRSARFAVGMVHPAIPTRIRLRAVILHPPFNLSYPVICATPHSDTQRHIFPAVLRVHCDCI